MVGSAEKVDGGYGWVIVFAFFVVEMLVDGVRFSYGLYFVEFLAEFKKPKADTAWIGGIMVGVYNLSGPLFALIVNKTGYRVASMIGTLTAVTGLLLSSFSTRLFHLYFSYGVLLGFGLGLLTLAGIVAISRYFLKKRATAMGIAFCGSGLGMFTFAPLVRLLFESYSWRGSFFILAGLILNCCISSVLFRPLSITEYSDNDSNDGELGCKKALRKVKAANDYISTEIQSPLLNTDKRPHQVMLAIKTKPLSPSLPRSFAAMRKEQLSLHKEDHTQTSHHSINMAVLSQSILGSNASFLDIIEKRRNAKTSNLNLQKSTIKGTDPVLPVKRFQNSVIENMFPKELLTNLNFVIMMMATFFTGIPSFIPFSMLPAYAISEGASPSQSAWLLSALGIGGLLGRIGAGILCDIPCVHLLTLNSVCYLVCGIATMVAAPLPMFEVLLMCFTVFGVFSGAVYVVQPIVLIEYIGERYISEIMGIMMWVYGVANFIGSPLAGWIFDVTGSYQNTFLVAGALYTLGGIINFFVLCTNQSESSRRQTNHQQAIYIEN